MTDLLKCLPGIAFWILGTIAAGVTYHRGHIPALVFALVSVFAFGVGVAINQRNCRGGR